MIFINLFHSKQQALSYRFSPNVKILNHKGIQLLPNKEEKYIQVTNVPGEGIELEDFQVFAVPLCGGEKTNISDSFMIERSFPDNQGIPQIEWSLKNLPELGNGLVYLEVNQMMEDQEGVYADTWYSNVFQITNNDFESTSRIDYRDDVLDTMLSTQLQVFFWHEGANDTLSTYTEAYTGDTITNEATYSKFEVWDMKRISRTFALKFKELFKMTYVYIDFIRCSPFAVFEIPEPTGTENDTKFSFRLSFKYNDVYDPNFVPPIPDDSPILEFIRVAPFNRNRVLMYYAAYNFEPTSLKVQYSPDGITFSEPQNFVTTLDEYTIGFGFGPFELPYPPGTETHLRFIDLYTQVVSNVIPITLQPVNSISSVIQTYLPNLNRFKITVNYNMSMYSGPTVIMNIKKNGNLVTEGTESNTGTVSKNIIGVPGDVITVFLKSTGNNYISETKTITLT